MIDAIIILLLTALAFTAGLLVSARFYEQMLEQHRYTEKILAHEKGIGYVSQLPKQYAPIGQPFMEKLKETGRATQKVR